MNTDEFLKKIKPAAKRSLLAPWWKEIRELREKSCTLDQVCKFLSLNGVEITIAGLSKYIKRREMREFEEKLHTKNIHIKARVSTSKNIEGLDSNPLRQLAGSRKVGDHNPIPQSTPEFDT